MCAKVVKKEANHKWNPDVPRGSVAYLVKEIDGTKKWFKPDDGKEK